MKFTAKQIAKLVHGKLEGDKNVELHRFSKIEEAQKNSLSFLANSKYESFIYNTKASVVLVNTDFIPKDSLPSSLTLIKVKNAYESLAELLNYYNSIEKSPEGIETPVFIHKSAQIGNHVFIGAFSYIAKDVIIGNHVQIHPNCHLGKSTIIGANSVLYPGVKIYDNCEIGNNCVIHSGAVIGSDGFGFAPNQENQYKKVAQIGNVVLKDQVEIGANSTIDRATIGSTVINKGVKIDNLVQIAHNVEVGENTVIAAQSGVAGSTKIDKNVMIGGQVGINGHIKIAKGTKIAAQTGVTKSVLKENTILQGTPAFDSNNFKRSYVLFKNFPKLKLEIESMQLKTKNNLSSE
jgi:UDP-3-O-[3-hydroxymyristoyl] glucosamine N-acyltransferase